VTAQIDSQKTLLITGASGGMGSACALQAAAEGYRLLLADLSLQKLEALAIECAERGAAADCHVLDVTRAEDIDGLLSAVAVGGGIDALIHTVGLSPQMAGWEPIVAVDLVGTIGLIERLRPHLRPGGCALGIASMSAYMVPEDPAIESLFADCLAEDFERRLHALAEQQPRIATPAMAYCYSKKALINHVAEHAFAWGAEGRRLVSISPGLIHTEMGKLENSANPEHWEQMAQRIALGRMGQAEDIAGAALYLVSDRAAYVTGIDLLVDGGFVARMRQELRQQATRD
jgi:NAD(P)-dependent dehydrogenase (short-subunit alcohol dehydrogenase family)